jgi:hypothetical protein
MIKRAFAMETSGLGSNRRLSKCGRTADKRDMMVLTSDYLDL